jgi:hypothetical protein
MTIARVRMLVGDHDGARGHGGVCPTGDIEAESALPVAGHERPDDDADRRLLADVARLLEGVRRREPSLQASSVREVGT